MVSSWARNTAEGILARPLDSTSMTLMSLPRATLATV